ncbi:MAG: hypothetical protein E7C86_01465 [Paeniclostridium sordellii]|uniref:Uncharacterized protein n=1 Tax=Paeniclostridium hominis TaxID=2764329 RepID=A0ABR7K4W2_9FIRM|nr:MULTISPECIES: hypothetical protein [Paeniclostridium]MBC6004139.1 hypothetical protein [Paeniclostridium hominis]MDU2591273.1 hypothetical protein [Paeniclostridium sordellii]
MNYITLSTLPSCQLNEFNLNSGELVSINSNTIYENVKTIFLVHNLSGKFIILYDINGCRKAKIRVPISENNIYYDHSDSNKTFKLLFNMK